MCVLKSLFFSKLPYFLELVDLPLDGLEVLHIIQSKLNNIVLNGKKPKMKLNNSALPAYQGGFGMIDIVSHYTALKIHILERALNVEEVEFWQLYLFSFFSVPFDVVVKCNLSSRAITNLTVRPLPRFWKEIFQIWSKFHLVNSTTSGSQEQFLEFLARPAYFNSAYGSPLGRNCWSLQTMEYFEDHGWFSGKDILKFSTKRLHLQILC